MGSCRNLGRSCSSSSHCDDCRCITGLSSCARQLFVCWTGGGNQSPPSTNYWTFSIIIFSGWRLHYSRGTRQHDEVTGCCSSRINVEYNTTTTTTRLAFHQPHLQLDPHMYPIPFNTNPPAASSVVLPVPQLAPLLKQRHVHCVSTDGFR